MLRVSRTKPLQKFLVAVVWGCELRRFEKMKNLVLVFLVPLISCRALLFDGDGKTFFTISRELEYIKFSVGHVLKFMCLSIQQFQLISCRSTSFSLSFQINFFHVRKYQVYYMFLSLIPATRLSNVKVQKSCFYVLLSFSLLFTPFHLLYFIFFVATYRFCTEIHTPYSMVECMTRADILRIAWYHSILLCYYH